MGLSGNAFSKTTTLIKKLVVGGTAIRAVRPDRMSVAEWDRLNSGAGNSHLAGEAIVNYNQSENEKVQQQGNAFIIMGRDRPRGQTSGWGAKKKVGNCACIDIVAGLGGIQAREISKPVSGHGGNTSRKKQRVTVEKHPQLDSARIYISQRANIDDWMWFNLPKGTIGNQRAKSAIAVKADCVRIIARDGGIKLVTNPDVYDSNGQPIRVYQGINIIAGSDDTTLQPMVKGDNLVSCLVEMVDMMEDLGKIIEVQGKYLFNLHKSYAGHTHVVEKGVLALPSLDGLLSLLQTDVMEILNKRLSFKWNAAAIKKDKLGFPGGEKNYILSFKNHVN